MKRTLSVLLVIVLLLSLCPAALAEDGGAVEAAEPAVTVDSYSEVFGTDAAHQVSDLAETEDGRLLVTYASAEAAVLTVVGAAEEDGAEFARVSISVEAGTADVTLDFPLASAPEYYELRAFLEEDGEAVSNVYVNADHTRAYAEFLALEADDPAFADRTVLVFGTDEEGRDNFAVVREDVRVIRVAGEDAVEKAEPEGDAVELQAAEGAEFYRLNEETAALLEDVDPGEKVLLIPDGDANRAVALLVGDLFPGEDSALLMTEPEKPGVEDYYELVRIHAEFYADNRDLDTSAADEDLVFADEAELMGSAYGSVEGTLETRFSWSKGPLTVSDTLTITAGIRVDLEYRLLLVKKLAVTVSLTTRNVFNIHASAGCDVGRSLRVGVIPVASAAVVSLDVPVDLVLRAGYSAVFDFTATQTATSTVKAGYDSGGLFCTMTRDVNCTRSLQTEAKAYASLGLRPGIRVSALGGVLAATINAEVGVKAVVTAQSVNDTATYKHDCLICLDVSLYAYAVPSVKFEAGPLGPWEKSGGTAEGRFAQFYLSYHGGKWSSGSGNCPYKRYLVTITVLDGENNTPLKGATVSGLGKTGADGKVSAFKSNGAYEHTVQLGGYKDKTVRYFVNSSPVNRTVKLSAKILGQAVMYTMTEWNSYTDDQRDHCIRTAGDEGVQVNIYTPADLRTLAVYTIGGKVTRDVIFCLSGSEPTLDMSEVGFVPIGSASNPFRGIFDGRKKTITGISGTKGLFAALDGAQVHDVILSGVAVESTGAAGAVADVAANGSEIFDVVASGAVSGAQAGGLVGRLEDSKLINCGSAVNVSGTEQAGGLAAAAAGDSEIANCYAVGGAEAPEAGGAAATVEETAAVRYAYYLDTGCEAVAAGADGAEILAFPVTEAQAQGTETDALISEDPDAPYAYTATLLHALNLWYVANGMDPMYAESDKYTVDDEGIPVDSLMNGFLDPYDRWFADQEAANGGYPVLASRGELYLLRVFFQYEDGTPIRDTVELYYAEGEEYDVDAYTIPGYYTADLETKGNMPPWSVDFYVVYIAATDYAGSGSALDTAAPAIAGTSWEIATAEDLKALAAYVNAGGATRSVTFEQTADLDLSGTGWTSIGSDAHPFNGVFNGGGYQIRGLDAPLFGALQYAEMQNVTLTLSDVTADGDAGLLAVSAKDSRFTGCEASGKAAAGGLAGGLAAKAENCTFDCCRVTGGTEVEGKLDAGGIAASLKDCSLMNCAVEVNVTSDAAAGGLAAQAENTEIVNGSSFGAVAGGTLAGGLAAKVSGGMLDNLYAAVSASAAAADPLLADVDPEDPPVLGSLMYEEDEGTSSYGSSFVRDEAGLRDLLDTLNGWVSSMNRTAYRTWAASAALQEPSGTDLPVLGEPYRNWITDLRVEDGVLHYDFNEEDIPNCTALIVFYDEAGRMTSVKFLDLAAGGETLDLEGAADYALILMDEDTRPVAAAVKGQAETLEKTAAD